MIAIKEAENSKNLLMKSSHFEIKLLMVYQNQHEHYKYFCLKYIAGVSIAKLLKVYLRTPHLHHS